MTGLAKLPSKIMNKWEILTFTTQPTFQIICNSPGGVASSAIFGWLEKYYKTNDIKFPRGKSLYKHTLYPPNYSFIEKGFFLFGEPCLSMMSIFRRELADTHLLNKGLPPIKINLEEYISCHSDIFRTKEHIYNWFQPQVSYPILAVKFDYLHNHLEELFDFLEIDKSLIPTFPAKRKRNSKLEDLPLQTQIGLAKILKEASSIYAESPNFKIIEASKI